MNPSLNISWEALALGIGVGPVCLASCGPLLAPWLIEQRRGLKQAARQLAAFLIARYGGYMLFATGAWGAGLALPQGTQTSVYAGAHLLLAVVLVQYAVGRWKQGECAAAGANHGIVTIGDKPSSSWGFALGFLTGLSLCPPFLAAGLRAAELRSLPLALLFFSLFFLGTAVWFLPLATLGWFRWKQPAAWMARLLLFLLAAYYAYVGLIALAGGLIHGH